jgi:hypothetical protein
VPSLAILTNGGGASPSKRCYTLDMPTTKPRHIVTETDEIAKALDDAARRWPQDSSSRAKLLVHLVQEGHRVLSEADAHRAMTRRAAIERTSGTLTNAYGADYLAELRDDWPA